MVKGLVAAKGNERELIVASTDTKQRHHNNKSNETLYSGEGSSHIETRVVMVKGSKPLYPF